MRKQEPFAHTSLIFIALCVFCFAGCTSSDGASGQGAPPPPSLPVVTLVQHPATVYQEYSASLEGSKDIDIRPQVEGYIEAVYVDEGAYVRRGQPLFKINDRTYREQLNTAKAGLAVARANLVNAEINVSKIAPLLQSNIVSEVQLKTARAAYNVAAAQVAQAQAIVRNAEINLGYTTVRAPADGYMGRRRFDIGSLVGLSTAEPLTVISDLKQVYAYFSMSERDYINFKQGFEGTSLEQKIQSMAPVELVLADGSVYPQKGKVEMATGQFNGTTGAITFRAAFPNAEAQLRSGSTGKLRLPLSIPSALVVPQEATFELQDKIYVFLVADSNKVSSVPIVSAGRSGNYYLVQKGLRPGDRIVYAGFDRLKDGMIILPQPLSMDSLFKTNAL